ncbi:Protein bfr2 [Penicillium angulare]|uniref:Protein bfr2 n=1 Tax=Penicillium angulare TaxID=116970 RepID=UPI0025414258|nr:Protein bfr2 [Penicillium angulare]KAJ5281765.1 Protein bfr2 [Penicillium angulare]
MAPTKARSLADQLADLEDPTPKDFDPEDLDRDVSSSDEGGDKTSDANAGREHYQAVGKGKLRKQEGIKLGKEYAGARVSRDALNADSDDDPFAAHSGESDDDQDSDEEIDSNAEEDNDGALTGSDSASDVDLDGSENEDDDDSDDITSGEGDEDDGTEASESDDSDEGAPPTAKRNAKSVKHGSAKPDDREELRRLMASDQKTIAATISQAAKADAAKGKAVKAQRITFDSLLNTRIKLQKGLSAIDEMSSSVVSGEKDATADSDEGAADEDAIKSAESAALALWSTLEELRTALADAHTKDGNKKRKRLSPVTPATESDLLWQRMADLESESLAHRRSTLDKWSSKVRGNSSSLPNARGKLLGPSGQQTITAVLDAHVATELGDRSSKRARQSTGANSSDAPQPIYDDTIFYQSLLRDLVEQRMSSSDAMTGGMDTLHQLPSRLPIHPVTGMRNDKVKRDIDTRASKGRKMRFNVHEKLQNFMAPEDRGVWTTGAREEFFASLLGRTASGLLGEGDESGSEEESDNDREEGGLKLFRN